eukprot:6210336-Pleurochrysis_carterae.AAC.2
MLVPEAQYLRRNERVRIDQLRHGADSQGAEDLQGAAYAPSATLAAAGETEAHPPQIRMSAVMSAACARARAMALE